MLPHSRTKGKVGQLFLNYSKHSLTNIDCTRDNKLKYEKTAKMQGGGVCYLLVYIHFKNRADLYNTIMKEKKRNKQERKRIIVIALTYSLSVHKINYDNIIQTRCLQVMIRFRISRLFPKYTD